MTSSLRGKVEKMEVSMTQAMIFPLISETHNKSAHLYSWTQPSSASVHEHRSLYFFVRTLIDIMGYPSTSKPNHPNQALTLTQTLT